MMEHSEDQRGSSLIELTVVLLLISVVGAVLFGFLFSVLNTTTRVTADTQTEQSVKLALRPLTADVRGASIISSTYPATSSCPTGTYPSGYTNCLSMTIQRTAAGALTCARTIVTYGLKNGVIRQDRTDYGLSGGSCVVTSSYTGRQLLTGVSNGSTPLFTYFDSLGNKLNPTGAGVTAGKFASALTVRVSVAVVYRAGSPSLSYTSDLALRNNR